MLNKQLTDNETYETYFSKFDKDYDNLLTPNQFFLSLKQLNQKLEDSLIQRIAHIFQAKQEERDIDLIPITAIASYFTEIN